MFQICYISQSNISKENTEEEVNNILNHARKNNKALGVTGLLVYREGWFCQYLECQNEHVLLELYGRICASKRHHKLTTIFSQSSIETVFPDWSMAYRKIESGMDEHFFADLAETLKEETFFSSDSIKKLMQKFYLYKKEL